MLNIDEKFFEGEERNGYYIEPVMKRAWAAQMEMLNDIRIVCEKYDIKWFVDWGTLLGTIRHGGFVPWDDDVDISMLRPDLNKFLEVAEQELGGRYEVHSLDSKEAFNDILSWVSNTRQITWEDEHIRKFHGFPFMAGIDIFPIDYVSRDEEQAETIRVIGKVLIEETLGLVDCSEEFAEQREGALQMLEGALGVSFDRNGNLKKQVLELATKLFSMYGEEDADEVAMIPFTTRIKGRTQHQKWCYSDVEWRDFEGVMKVPVPIGWDEILRSKYGDYNEVKMYHPHGDFPFFKRQQEDLKAFVEEHPEVQADVEKLRVLP